MLAPERYATFLKIGPCTRNAATGLLLYETEWSLASRYVYEPKPGGSGWIGDENSAELFNTTIQCKSVYKAHPFEPWNGQRTIVDGSWSVIARPSPGAPFARLTSASATDVRAVVRATAVYNTRRCSAGDAVVLSLDTLTRENTWIHVGSTIGKCERVPYGQQSIIEVSAMADPATLVRLELSAAGSSSPGLEIWLKSIRLFGPICVPNPDPESPIRCL